MSGQTEFRFEAQRDGSTSFFNSKLSTYISSDGYSERLTSIFDFFPLYELKQKTSLVNYHGFELGVCLLLFIMEKMLKHSHCTYEDCEDFICNLLPRMVKVKPENSDELQVARKLLDELTNRGSPFVYTFYNPFTGEEQQVKFRLLEQRPLNILGRDTITLRLTEKGLEMLFKSREIYRDLHFSVMQLYLDQQIRRGVFDGALKTVSELEVAVEGIEEECRRQREHVRRNVIESISSADYNRLLKRMEEQLQREQHIFDNLKELVRETRQRLENEVPRPDSRIRTAKIIRLSNALNHVAARHLELISSRADLENLVGQVLQESIYTGLMVRFHLKKEFLDTVMQNNPPGEALVKTVLAPLMCPNVPRLLGPETFLAPQRLLGRGRERPLEAETDEQDLAAWEKRQRAEKEHKDYIIRLLQYIFTAILQMLIDRQEVTVADLLDELGLESSSKAEVAAFTHLLMLLHQSRRLQAFLPWPYVPGDEDLMEYAFYRLLIKRPEFAAIGPVEVNAGEGLINLPHGIEINNMVIRRSGKNDLQPEDIGNLSGAVERTS